MQAGAKPRRAPAAKGGQRGGQGARSSPGRHRSTHPSMPIAAPAGRDPAADPGMCHAHVPWQGPGGWEPLCFLSFKLQYSLKGQGMSVLCCRCLCISWRGLLERGEQGRGITEEWGLCPGKHRWDRQRLAGRVRAGSTFYDESPGLGGTKWVPW